MADARTRSGARGGGDGDVGMHSHTSAYGRPALFGRRPTSRSYGAELSHRRGSASRFCSVPLLTCPSRRYAVHGAQSLPWCHRVGHAAVWVAVVTGHYRVHGAPYRTVCLHPRDWRRWTHRSLTPVLASDVGTAGLQYENGRTKIDPAESCLRFNQCRPEEYAQSVFGRGLGLLSATITPRRNQQCDRSVAWLSRPR